MDNAENRDKSRLSWDELAINLAKEASKRSEDLYRKVGAVAMNHEHRVLGVAYNGLASGKDADESFWVDRDERRIYMIHAEQNLMALCKKGEIDIVAVTTLPCSSCATLLAAHGVKKVLYFEEYDRDQGSKKIFEFYNIELVKIS